MNRRSFLTGGLFIGAASLVSTTQPSAKTKGFYLKRKLIAPDGVDLDTVIVETKSYVSYKKLFNLDKEFKNKKMLIWMNMEKGDNHFLVTRQFASDEARRLWMQRFDEAVLFQPEKISSFRHRYEVELSEIA